MPVSAPIHPVLGMEPDNELRRTERAGSVCLLPSDGPERDRLNRQHEMLKELFEGRAVLAPVTLDREDDRVLDVGTGSGAFLLGLLSTAPPSVRIDAVDIEPRLWPLSDARVLSRGNVHFHTASITALPAAWSGAFTFVHQRLLISALLEAQWPAALGEIFRVLAPGGWVQLGESGAWRAGPKTARHAEVVHALFRAKCLMIDCATRVPELLREAGFGDVRVEERGTPLGRWTGEAGVEASENLIAVFRAMKGPILEAGGFGLVESEAALDDLLDEVKKEWDEMPGAESRFCIICAQKPR